MSIDTSLNPNPAAEQTQVEKFFKCEEDGCGKSFPTQYRLKRHRKSHLRIVKPKTHDLVEHHGERPFKCDFEGCEKSYKTDAHLKRHKLKSHSMEEHTPAQVMCKVKGCGNVYCNKYVLKQHMSSAHADYQDDVAPIDAKKKPDVVKNHRSDEPYKPCAKESHADHQNDVVPKASKRKSDIEKNHRCDEPGCNAAFFRPYRLKNHKLAAHSKDKPFECDYQNCGKRCTNESHADHQDVAPKASKKRSDVEKNHICDEPGCNAAFFRPYRLKNHKLTAHGKDKPFECDYQDCGKRYTNESHLARHKSTSHYPDSIDMGLEVICGEEGCGRIFSNKDNLKKHISKVHTAYPFSCTECGEKFKRKSRLHSHDVEVHNKEAPYKCDSCPKRFVHLNIYNRHLRDHKTYQCDCEKIFDKWTKFLKHRKTECTVKPREHKCVICGKTFYSKCRLTQHSLRVHIPDSQCDLIRCPYLNCTRLYKHPKNLKDHIRTFHERIFKTIQCTEKNCNVVLKSNRNLKQHLRIIHHGLPAKLRKPRRPRKDRGIPKESMASLLSGVEVNAEETYRNIMGNTDENLDRKVLVCAKEEGNRKNDELKICNKKFEDKIEDGKSQERIISNTMVKESSAYMDSLEDCQKTTLDGVNSSPMSTTAEGNCENLQEVTSFSLVSMDNDDECSKHPTDLEVDKLKEPTSNINDNLKNWEEAKIKVIKLKEIVGHNKTLDTTALTCHMNDEVVVMDVDPESIENAIILAIPSNVNLRQLQNDEINNVDKMTSGDGVKYTSLQIVESLHSDIHNVPESIVVETNTSRYTTHVPNDNIKSGVSTDCALLNSSHNSCDSGVVIFDFPELATAELSNNIETDNKEAMVEEETV